jgi:hypothetical protein
MLVFSIVSFLYAISNVEAVTVYGQIPLQQTYTAARASPTVLAAYNDTQLGPPPVPSPRQFSLTLQHDAAVVPGLSIPHIGTSFFGFSIEMSVISQVRKYPFLAFCFDLPKLIQQWARTRMCFRRKRDWAGLFFITQHSLISWLI